MNEIGFCKAFEMAIGKDSSIEVINVEILGDDFHFKMKLSDRSTLSIPAYWRITGINYGILEVFADMEESIVYYDLENDYENNSNSSDSTGCVETPGIKMPSHTKCVGDVCSVSVTDITHDGLVVESTEGIVGIIPKTEVSYNIVPLNEVYSVGMELSAKIIQITEDDDDNSTIFSIKQLKESPWNSLEFSEGDVVEGVVAALKETCAFVNVGPVYALLYFSELSWHDKSPIISDYINVGQTIKVKILRINSWRERMIVSLREASESFEDVLGITPGMIQNVTIIQEIPKGYNVEFGDDYRIRGFISNQEVAWTDYQRRSLQRTLSPGSIVKAVIIGVIRDTREVSLSIKRLYENPFDAFGKAYPVGSFVDGIVMSYTETKRQQYVLVNLPIFGPLSMCYNPKWGISFDSLQEQYPIDSVIQFVVRARSEMKTPFLKPIFGPF